MGYLGEKRLANFRKVRTEGPTKHKNSEAYKDRPGMSEAHLALVRKMPCAICLRTPGGDPHHLKSVPGTRGAGIRAEDKWSVPLCRTDHEIIERAGTRNEVAKFKECGIDNVHLLAADLWKITGDLPKMIKVLMAHRSHK